MPTIHERQPEIIIRPCTHSGLAKAYGVSPKVLTTWLRPHHQAIGPRKGYFYSLEQLFVVFDLIGWPPPAATYLFFNEGGAGGLK